MPRGAKKDITVTRLLFENGLLLDKRSFVSWGAEPHLYLKGEDVGRQRERLWLSGNSECEICRKPIHFNQIWQMDHKQGGLVGRCDCRHNLRITHAECHRARHVQVQLRSIPMEAL
jgi:hypothetical protein